MRKIRSLAFALALVAAGQLSAHEAKHPAPAAPGAPLAGGGTRDARSYFTDTSLLTQEGRAVRFYSDVLEGRVVLINVIYTSCQDACPLITRKLREVREALGEPLAQRIRFVSISSDPERDSPQALADFAREQGIAGPDWVLLTGARANLDLVLGRLGQLAPSAEEHSTLLIAGDVPNKRWSKIAPDAPPVAIAERLKLLVEGPAARAR